MNHWICTTASTGWKEMAHCWEENIVFWWKKNCLWWWTEGGLRECSQEWPYLSPLPPLSLIGSGLMNDGGGKRWVRGGKNLLAKLSEPAECKEDKRLLCVSYCCVWTACWGGGGKGGCTRTEKEGGRSGGSEEQQSRSKKDYRRFCCWPLLKMYVPLFFWAFFSETKTALLVQRKLYNKYSRYSIAI